MEHRPLSQPVCCSILPGLESGQLCCLVPPEYTGQWPHLLLLACQLVNPFPPRLCLSPPSSSSCWYGYWWGSPSTSWVAFWGRTWPQALRPHVGPRILPGRSHRRHGIAVWSYIWPLEDSYHSGKWVWLDSILTHTHPHTHPSVTPSQCHISGALLHICHSVGSRGLHSVRDPTGGLPHPHLRDSLHLCGPHLLPAVHRGLPMVVEVCLLFWVRARAGVTYSQFM